MAHCSNESSLITVIGVTPSTYCFSDIFPNQLTDNSAEFSPNSSSLRASRINGAVTALTGVLNVILRVLPALSANARLT